MGKTLRSVILVLLIAVGGGGGYYVLQDTETGDIISAQPDTLLVWTDWHTSSISLDDAELEGFTYNVGILDPPEWPSIISVRELVYPESGDTVKKQLKSGSSRRQLIFGEVYYDE